MMKRLSPKKSDDAHLRSDGADGKTSPTALDDRFANARPRLNARRQRHVLVVGLDFASSLSYYLAYGLLALGFDADAPIGSSGNLQYKVEALTSRDVLVAISFGQCLRDSVEAVLRARKQGVPTFGITDSGTSPIARYCDAHLIAPVVSPSFLNSYVAPMAAISAIHVACAHIDPKRSLNRLRPTDREYASGARWYREPKGFNGDLP